MIYSPIAAVIVMLIVVVRSFKIWQLISLLPDASPNPSIWRRLLHFTALIQPAILLLIIAIRLTTTLLDKDPSLRSVFLTLSIIITLTMMISRIVYGLLSMSLLAYAAQLARRTGHRAKLAWVSAFLVPLPQWIYCVLLALFLALGMSAKAGNASAAILGVYGHYLVRPTPVLIAEFLTTAWTGVVLWLVSNRLAKQTI